MSQVGPPPQHTTPTSPTIPSHWQHATSRPNKRQNHHPHLYPPSTCHVTAQCEPMQPNPTRTTTWRANPPPRHRATQTRALAETHNASQVSPPPQHTTPTSPTIPSHWQHAMSQRNASPCSLTPPERPPCVQKLPPTFPSHLQHAMSRLNEDGDGHNFKGGQGITTKDTTPITSTRQRQ